MRNDGLRNYSNEDLEEELKERKIKEMRPKIIIDITEENKELINTCEQALDDASNPDLDTEYVYEEAMKMVYGENVFDWINKNIE
jgi:hypothetical protein